MGKYNTALAADKCALPKLHSLKLERPDPSAILSSLTDKQIQAAVDQKFVHMEEIGGLLAAALRNGENVILWGPGGQAKSQVVEHVLKALNLDNFAKVQVCDVGTEVASLYGGINFRSLQERGQLEYALETSIFGKEIAVLEELFDASPEVLASLKNALTSKMVYTENVAFPVRTKSIIACTNRSPEEIASLGESYRALVDRFTLQYEVKWPSYGWQDYMAMFLKQGASASPQLQKLAEIIAKAGTKDKPITPRTAMKALKIATDSAAMRGKSSIDEEAMNTLRHIPGLGQTVQASLKTWRRDMQAENLERQKEVFSERLKAAIDGIRSGKKSVEETLESVASMRDSWSIFLRDYPADMAKTGNELTCQLDKAFDVINGFSGQLGAAMQDSTPKKRGKS